MRLPPPLVELIARRMVQALQEKGILSSDHPERTIEKVVHLLTADLKVEDEITEEARQVLLRHQDELKGKDLEYHALIAKAKAQIAARRGYTLSTGPGRLSREKQHDLAHRIFALFLDDPDVEYFVKDDDFRVAVLKALELELARDAAREQKARQKVLSIKRRIPEESPEFHALFQQFYRELLDKGQ